MIKVSFVFYAKNYPLVPLSFYCIDYDFGSAENYEFAAIKSSGISLQRAMRSLTVLFYC
jgi:lipopolysaccharide export system permease protein